MSIYGYIRFKGNFVWDIWCLLRIHHWHYFQFEALRKTTWKSRTSFWRECLVCKRQECLGWRRGPLGHTPEKPIFEFK